MFHQASVFTLNIKTFRRKKTGMVASSVPPAVNTNNTAKWIQLAFKPTERRVDSFTPASPEFTWKIKAQQVAATLSGSTRAKRTQTRHASHVLNSSVGDFVHRLCSFVRCFCKSYSNVQPTYTRNPQHTVNVCVSLNGVASVWPFGSHSSLSYCGLGNRQRYPQCTCCCNKKNR